MSSVQPGETYVVGVDFGTESGRAVVVRAQDGTELASAVCPYPHGVIDRSLPESGRPLPPEWALQDPEDYLTVLRTAIPRALKESGVDPSSVVGIGLDFTSCTMLPTTADGTPLCSLPEWRDEPHAWVKLWKHHTAQGQAIAGRHSTRTARTIGIVGLVPHRGALATASVAPRLCFRLTH